MKRIVGVRLDCDWCLSHFACSGEAPRVFINRRDGTHHPSIADDVQELLDSERSAILRAVFVCPTTAISATFEDGRTITSEDGDPERGVAQWIDY